MIRAFRLLRNLAQFENVDSGSHLPLGHVAVFYSENGRGKTTLAETLRAFAASDPVPIEERARLGSTDPPQVVIETDDGSPAAVFENGAWNRRDANILVFDDEFVDQNVHSGLTVAPGHRQRLHELVLGAQAVTLVNQLQEAIERIEGHNATLRGKAAAIPAAIRGNVTVDDFCALPRVDDVDAIIDETRRNLAVAEEGATVSGLPAFEALEIPAIDLHAVNTILGQGLPDLEEMALAHVREHLATLGPGGEAWVSDGMRRIPTEDNTCPFCGQELSGSTVIGVYQAYFSLEYRQLEADTQTAYASFQRMHGGDAQASFERALRKVQDTSARWSKYIQLPDLPLGTERLVARWGEARDRVLAVLGAKLLQPLDVMTLNGDTEQAITDFETDRAAVAQVNELIAAANLAIAVARERATAANTTTLASDLARLRAIGSRYSDPIDGYCTEYLAERAAKEATEHARDELRTRLETLRTTAFPGYQEATNRYLQRFNAEFRIANITSINTRGGPTVTYNVLVNGNPVAVGGGDAQPGVPSFKSALSAGDRNTLALAFFFALVEQDPQSAARIVIVDDPITSLDDQRSWATVQELKQLANRVSQLVVLSHEKAFLCRLWDVVDRTSRSAIEIVRQAAGSTLRAWDVDADSVTEHDRRDARFREYLSAGATELKGIASDLRPHLEAYIRVAAPQLFQPGNLLGPFLQACRDRLGHPDQLLDAARVTELQELVDYANRFHHDTNPSSDTAAVTDGELRGMVRRTLAFARP